MEPTRNLSLRSDQAAAGGIVTKALSIPSFPRTHFIDVHTVIASRPASFDTFSHSLIKMLGVRRGSVSSASSASDEPDPEDEHFYRALVENKARPEDHDLATRQDTIKFQSTPFNYNDQWINPTDKSSVPAQYNEAVAARIAEARKATEAARAAAAKKEREEKHGKDKPRAGNSRTAGTRGRGGRAPLVSVSSSSSRPPSVKAHIGQASDAYFSQQASNDTENATGSGSRGRGRGRGRGVAAGATGRGRGGQAATAREP